MSNGTLTIDLCGESLILHPDRAVYWPATSTLLLSDLHLGKAAHFRRAGIAVPAAVSDADFSRLQMLLATCQPARVLLLGDLFHSRYNHIWDEFCTLTARFATTRFELVPGNHDILGPARYADAGLYLHEEIFCDGPFCFSHHPLPAELIPGATYNLAGHVHPCVHLRGPGGQSLRLPCFYFGRPGGILPAFGAFTGCGEVPAREGDRVYVLTPEKVMEVQ